MYKGSISVTAVDEYGRNQYEVLNEGTEFSRGDWLIRVMLTVATGDIWYFPKGAAHAVQGLADQNEYLLAFDDGNFDASGTTFMVDDWLAHTPKDILAKNFGQPVAEILSSWLMGLTSCRRRCVCIQHSPSTKPLHPQWNRE